MRNYIYLVLTTTKSLKVEIRVISSLKGVTKFKNQYPQLKHRISKCKIYNSKNISESFL